jgi:hypothetical protein
MKPLKAIIEVELTIKIEPQYYDWDLIEEYDTLSDGLIGVVQREVKRLQGLNDFQIDVTQAAVHIDDYGDYAEFVVCPRCGGKHYHRRSVAYIQQHGVCPDCPDLEETE